MLPEPEALTTLEREPDSLPTPADDIDPASPIQLAIPPVRPLLQLSVPDESDTAFRPLGEMESSDFDISHRRDVEEIDAEPHVRYWYYQHSLSITIG